MTGSANHGAAFVRADAGLIAHTAGQALDTSGQLSQLARQLANVDLGPPDADTAWLTAPVWRAYRDYVAALRDALDRFAEELEADADRLYQVAFALQASEQAAMIRLRRSGHAHLAGWSP